MLPFKLKLGVRIFSKKIGLLFPNASLVRYNLQCKDLFEQKIPSFVVVKTIVNSSTCDCVLDTETVRSVKHIKCA